LLSLFLCASVSPWWIGFGLVAKFLSPLLH
jgi:hypothetical protein